MQTKRTTSVLQCRWRAASALVRATDSSHGRSLPVSAAALLKQCCACLPMLTFRCACCVVLAPNTVLDVCRVAVRARHSLADVDVFSDVRTLSATEYRLHGTDAADNEAATPRRVVVAFPLGTSGSVQSTRDAGCFRCSQSWHGLVSATTRSQLRVSVAHGVSSS